MIDMNFNLIGQDNNFAENSFALGYATHNRYTTAMLVEYAQFSELTQTLL